MTGDERREQILRAARRVFAEKGFGATTDEVARAAGVSQPYVVRLFGTKRGLLAEVHRHATDELVETFRAVETGPHAASALGDAYIRLMADRDLLRLLMHGFVVGPEDELGAMSRHTFAEVYRVYRDRTGADPEEVCRFIAHGMLVNVLLGIGAPEHPGEDEALDALVASALGAMPDGAR